MIDEVDVSGDGRIDFNGKISSLIFTRFNIKLLFVCAEFVRALADPSDGSFFF